MRGESTILGTFYCWLAWKLPRGLVEWCSVRLMVDAACGRTLCEVTCLDALEAWRTRPPGHVQN